LESCLADSRVVDFRFVQISSLVDPNADCGPTSQTIRSYSFAIVCARRG